MCVRAPARVCACVCACFSFSLEDVNGFAAGCSLRILDCGVWAVSTTHPYNPFCTVGLYQEKKAQPDGGGADQENLLEIHTHIRKREED